MAPREESVSHTINPSVFDCKLKSRCYTVKLGIYALKTYFDIDSPTHKMLDDMIQPTSDDPYAI